MGHCYFRTLYFLMSELIDCQAASGSESDSESEAAQAASAGYRDRDRTGKPVMRNDAAARTTPGADTVPGGSLRHRGPSAQGPRPSGLLRSRASVPATLTLRLSRPPNVTGPGRGHWAIMMPPPPALTPGPSESTPESPRLPPGPGRRPRCPSAAQFTVPAAGVPETVTTVTGVPVTVTVTGHSV